MNPQRNLPRRALAAMLAMVMIPIVGQAMTFSVVSVAPDDRRHIESAFLLMQGEVVPGDYDRLIAFAIRNHVDLTRKLIILSSPGGDVSEALKLGQLIKSLYMSVSVGPADSSYEPCASACFILYASAVERSGHPGRIGVHRPYLSPERLRTLSPADAEALETRALTDAEAYLHKLRVPTSLVEAMFEQASTEIHWLTFDELETQLGRRAPWYEELLIARCGLNKDAELKFLTDPTYADSYRKLAGVWTCGLELTHPEAVKNFAKALRPYAYGFSDENGFYRLASPPPTPGQTALTYEQLRACSTNPKSSKLCPLPPPGPTPEEAVATP